MAKREISSTLRNLKFMQRAAVREEKTKKQEEEKPDGNFFSLGTIRKCVVITEGDPHPGASIGRMSFQSFNPSVDKLNEDATNLGQPKESDVYTSTSNGQSGQTSLRANVSSIDGAECSSTDNSKSDGDLKRKQSEVVLESPRKNKSPKTEGGQQSSPNSNKGFKQPKRDKLNWSVLRPKSQNKRV